jgi:hypothetical protein
VLPLSSPGSQGLLPAGEDCAEAGCSRRLDRGVPHALEGSDSGTVGRTLCGLKPGAGDTWANCSSGKEQDRTGNKEMSDNSSRSHERSSNIW